MTAGIAVMNTKGAALAIDSAVTTSKRGKLYNSADKLFELSTHHPIAILVYGIDNFLRVPWETVIKTYGYHMQGRYFDTLEEYAKDFFDFLMNNEYNALSDKDEDIQFTFGSLDNEILRIYNALSQFQKDLRVETHTLNCPEQLEEKYFEKCEAFLKKELKVMEKQYIGAFAHLDFTLLIEEFGKYVARMIDDRFEQGMLKEEWKDKIIDIACNRVLKGFTHNHSGIVFAGFGEKELFPSVISYKVEGKINGNLKYQKYIERSLTINPSNRGAVIPFAQVDSVTALTTGIDPKLKNHLTSKLKVMLHLVNEELVEQLKEHLKDDADTDKIKGMIHSTLLKGYRNYNDEMFAFQNSNYMDSIIDIVESLPKKELAEMAEALINFTTLKKKISPEVESVGGPVDVVVITKGDGLEWIKQKKYADLFEPK